MTKTPVPAITGSLTAVVLIGATVVGCSTTTKSSSPSSSSAASSSSTSATAASSSFAAPAGDFTGLLIKASDINVPNDTFTAVPANPAPGGQPGVVGSFTNQAGTRVIGDTILILPDAAAATTSLERSKSALGSNVTGTPEASPVGTGGTVVAGKSPDGAKSITVLLFTEGRAFTTIEFDSAPDDPVPPEVVNDIGQKQDAAIKAGLPN